MEEEIKKEVVGKAGFPLYVDYWEKYFSQMSGEQVKECLKIIFHFNMTFEVLETNDLAIKMVINTIIDNLKRDAGKRLKQSKASRENGKNGGRPPKDKKPTTNPTKPKKTQSVFIKPTLQEIKDYCSSRKNNIDAQYFFDYYQNGNWCDKDGKPLKNWKQKIITWESRNSKKQEQKSEYQKWKEANGK